MKPEEITLQLIKSLQSLRGGVPTFVLAEGFGGTAVIKIRKALLDVPMGEEVDIILHSGGGSADDAYRLIRTFRSRYNTVNVIVPFWAKSAATIFAFGGSRIVLHEFGELGPLDAQIKKSDEDGLDVGYASALNVQSSLQQIEDRARVGVIEMFKSVSTNRDIRISKKQLFEMLLTQSSQFYEPLLQKIDTMEIGSMARYLEIGQMYAKRILKQYSNITDEKLDELLDFLVYGSPDHGYVVDYSILHQYLDNVITTKDEPFGDDYNTIIDNLSLVLMQSDLEKIGFIDILLPDAEPIKTKQTPAKSKQKNDTIEAQEEEKNSDESAPDSSANQAERAHNETSKNPGTQKPRKNSAKRKAGNSKSSTAQA